MVQKKRQQTCRSGFTLVEMIIYIAIIAGILLAFVSFVRYISDTKSKVFVVEEVHTNMRTAMEILKETIRGSSEVVIASSTFGADPGALTLYTNATSTNPTIIDLTADDGYLRIQEGANDPILITTSDVRVTRLVFEHVSANAARSSVRVYMTMSYNPAAEAQIFQYDFSVTSTINTRT